MPAAHDHANDLVSFVQASPSSFHVAAEVGRRLAESGFTEQEERWAWDGSPGGHYLIRDGAIVAWWVPRTAVRGFRIVGAHTDSPGFKLKPNPTTGFPGWQQAGLEVYGGPLVNSWLDREFELAGRVVSRQGRSALVRTGAWLRIPQVAPHLDRSVHESLKLDRQQHLLPVYGVGRPDLDVLAAVAELAGMTPDEVGGHDLVAAATQPPEIFGLASDLLASARLDNLSSVHAGLVALQDAEECDDITVLACFDHEEVGSQTPSGASGPLLEQVLERIALASGMEGDTLFQMLAASSCVSADAGHAVHPNYPHLHDPGHRPLLNKGPLLKVNANQRYASDAVSAALWQRACDAAGAPTQTFVSNNAVPCGSTIGPLTATRLGISTVDVGIPLLSMHSARELAGVLDPWWLSRALRAYLSGA